MPRSFYKQQRTYYAVYHLFIIFEIGSDIETENWFDVVSLYTTIIILHYELQYFSCYTTVLSLLF